MTSTAQIVGGGIGGGPGFGAPAVFGRRSAADGARADARDADRLPGRGDAGDEAATQPGRRPSVPAGDARSATDIPRLPGQEGRPEGGPRRPLIAGGAFTLAVAIGLALDRLGRPETPEPGEPSDPAADDGEASGEPGLDGLTEAERELVRELQQRDAEVRRHEAAHAAAGGQYAGAPSFTYQTGPDGKRYAVGGEVSIDTAPVKGDPAATIRKAQQIKAAANAPADPSSQDRRVAAAANALQQSAQAELLAQQRAERQAAEAETAAADASVPPAVAGAQAPSPAPEGGLDIAATATGDSGAGTDATGAPRAGFGPADAGSESSSSPDTDTPDTDRPGTDTPNAGTSDSDRDGAFGAAAFSAAAASYRGPAERSSLVSLAV